uniref:Uncharacterized protein n=1 Tax=Kalanchoe fedtschenkoi TaxID=63787 RepID=A0A7N0ZVA8_KALFE
MAPHRRFGGHNISLRRKNNDLRGLKSWVGLSISLTESNMTGLIWIIVTVILVASEICGRGTGYDSEYHE